MSNPPFPFLSTLPSATSTVASLSMIQLFSDTSQRLIFAQGNFLLEAYQRTDFADLMLDFPESIKASVIKRQAEYLAGRHLGRLAMEQSQLFNPEPPQLGIGLLRAPAWPEVVTGSITHHQCRACAVVLTQPLSAENFVGVDTELWLTAQQASEISESIHNSEELQILVSACFTNAQATSLLFSAKEALFKAICPFVGEYFGFEAAELKACSGVADTAAKVPRSGWLQLQLVTDWVVAKAPQLNYCCWFSCSELDVLTMVCSYAINTQLFESELTLSSDDSH
jgi:enterobactin synthetase component D